MIKNMELAQVRRGESFILDGVKFVKLDEDAQHEQEIAEQKTCDEGASDAD
jgi:hypothetical protein